MRFQGFSNADAFGLLSVFVLAAACGSGSSSSDDGGGGKSSMGGTMSGGSAGSGISGRGGSAGSSGATASGGTSGDGGSTSGGEGGLAGGGGTGGGEPECAPGVGRVTEAAEVSARPSLVRTADGFAVAWHDQRDGNAEIYFQRLGDDGSALGDAVRVTDDAAAQTGASLVATDGGFGVAWADNRNPNQEIYFQRLSPSGAAAEDVTRVTNADGVSAEVEVAWSGERFGLVWNDNRGGNFDIYFVELDENGAKLEDERPLTTATTDSFRPALVWTGADYGVVWNDDREGNWEIYFDWALAPDDAVRVTMDAGQSLFASLAWTGSGFGVAWQEGSDDDTEIYFALLDESGRKLGEDVPLTDDDAPSGGASLAWTGSDFVVTWDDARTGDGDIYRTAISEAGVETGDDTPLSPAAAVSIFSSVAIAGEGFGVAWADERDGNSEIYFARVCP